MSILSSIGVDEYKRILNNAREKWMREKDLPPVAVPSMPRATVLAQNRNALQGGSRSDQTMIRSTLWDGFKPFSHEPELDLKPIGIREMFARKVHRGRIVLLRTISLPARTFGVDLAVEDPSGEAVTVALYNYPTLTECDIREIKEFFPVGCLFAIREPWMKLASHGTGKMIRVDSPSDVVLLRPDHPLLRGVTWKTHPQVPLPIRTSAEEYKQKGTDYFKRGLYLLAARAWSGGLEIDPSMTALRLNRCQAYLSLGWFLAALGDAIHVLSTAELDPSLQLKASYRAARAEYGVGRYAEARMRFESIRGDLPSQASWIPKCDQRIQEAQTGKYDWMQMLKAGQESVPRLDVADYTGPIVISAVPDRGGGRGVRAAEAIEPGTLLVVAKPFVAVFWEEIEPQGMIMGINLVTNRLDSSTKTVLKTRVAAKLHGCPETAPLLRALYQGPSGATPPPSYPPPAEGHAKLCEPLVHTIDIDPRMVDNIVDYNSFNPMGFEDSAFKSSRSPEHATALYTLPSLFNHACRCAANAFWHCLGDVIVIRAVTEISAGEEITIPYASGETYLEREQQLAALLPQGCDCFQCEADRLDGRALCMRRRSLVERHRQDSRAGKSRPGASVKVLEQCTRDMELTYTVSRKALRPCMFWPFKDLMDFHLKEAIRRSDPNLMRKSIQYGCRALESVGLRQLSPSAPPSPYSLPVEKRLFTAQEGVDSCIMIMVELSFTLYATGDSVGGKRWRRAAWWLHEGALGGGRELFDFRFKEMIDVIHSPDPFNNLEYRWE